jgi:hypothetical protein
MRAAVTSGSASSTTVGRSLQNGHPATFPSSQNSCTRSSGRESGRTRSNSSAGASCPILRRRMSTRAVCADPSITTVSATVGLAKSDLIETSRFCRIPEPHSSIRGFTHTSVGGSLPHEAEKQRCGTSRVGSPQLSRGPSRSSSGRRWGEVGTGRGFPRTG